MVKYICSVLLLAVVVSVAFAQVQETPVFEDDPDEIEVFEICLSGGRGSSSCSNNFGGGYTGISGNVACSVDCTSGYYACCDEVSCKCKPIYSNH